MNDVRFVSPTMVGRSYWLTWAATLAFFGSFYALLVPLPHYLAAIGLTDAQIGIVLGTFGIASLIGRPIAGVAVDRSGARHVMFVGAGALLLGAFGVVTTTNLLLLILLRLLQALGYVAFTTAGTALVVLLSAPQDRGRRLALFGIAANVAIALTPAAMSALLAIVPLTSGFLVAGGLAGVSGLLAAFVPAVQPTAQLTSAQPTWRVPRSLWLPMLITGLFGAGFAAFFQFVPILAERRGSIAAGVLYTVYGVGIMLTRVLGGGVLDRTPLARVLVGAVLLMACGLGFAAFAIYPGALVVSALLIAAGSGLSHPALIAHHAALLPASPGRATAAFYIGFDLGIGLGSWLFGVVLQYADVTGMYVAAALLVALALPLACRLSLPAHHCSDAL